MNTTLKKAIQDQGGGALVLTLVLLMIGGLIMAPLLGYMGTGHIAAGVHEKRMDELYAADAGIEDAVWRIQNPVAGGLPAIDDCNDQWAEEFEPYEIDVNGTTVIVSIDYLGDDKYRVVSTTTGGDSTTAVESYVFWGSHWEDILNFGVIALRGNIYIGPTELNSYPDPGEARIYANGDILMEGAKSKVYGDAYATGRISHEENIVGSAYPDHHEIAFRDPDLAVYQRQALLGDLFEDLPDNTLEILTDQPLGPAYINGNLKIASQSTVTLGGPVWVTGSVDVDGGSEIVGEGPLMAGGKITIRGCAGQDTEKMPVIISTAISATDDPDDYTIWFSGSDVAFMVLYAPEGMIKISGGADVNGAVIGKAVRIESARCNAVYDMEVVNRVRAPYIVVLTWEVQLQ